MSDVTSEVVSKPPGLAQIAYRADDFTGFRRALMRSQPGEQSIAAWRPARGDFGLQVLEWWAYLADVLTFYNERIANESYLRTAGQAENLANLVALLGYQPAPATSATGYVAALRKPGGTAVPLGIPAGMRLSSVATPGVPSQTFEVDAAASFAGPSRVPVTLPPDTTLPLIAGAPSGVLLAGRVSGIKVGDQLMLAERNFAGTDDIWSLVSVTSLTPQSDPNTGAVNTQVGLSPAGWGPQPAPTTQQPAAPPSPPPESLTVGASSGRIIDRFPGRVASVFSVREMAMMLARPVDAGFGRIGVRSPTWGDSADTETNRGTGSASPAAPSTDATSYRLLRPSSTAALFNAAALNAPDGQAAVVPSSGSHPHLKVHLSAAVRSISAGDMVLFDGGTNKPSAFAVVSGTAEALATVPYPGNFTATPSIPNPPDIVIAHTVLHVTTQDFAVLQNADPSTITVRYGFKDVGTIIGVPAPSLPSLPATVNVPEAYTPPPGGTTALLQDVNGAGVLVTVTGADSGQVTLAGAGTPPSTISDAAPLVAPLELLLDVLAVSRGTTVTGEVLGSGNASLAGQSFTLSKSPLTYLAQGNGAISTLAVYVDGVEWHEVSGFYGQPADARVFVVSRSPDQTVTTVMFGDGVNGARLTSGTGNVSANYRYGAGAARPPAGSLTTISQPQPGLASISNPVAVFPGADAQSTGSIRSNAPASVFTFGRAISADDYRIVALEAPGVRRATAVWTFDDPTQRTLVTIYVGDDQAAVAAASAALAGAEDPNRPVSVVQATPIDLYLSCNLVVAADRQIPAVVAAATTAICDPVSGLFNPARMGVGQRLYRSAINAALAVPGVVAVHDLTVTWLIHGTRDEFVYRRDLDQFFDPDEGSFFRLLPDNLTMGGVSSGA
jgi:hypothetical protein